MLVSFIRSANKKKMSRMYHLGQNGAAVMLTKEQAEIATKEIQLNGLNIFASNLIPLDRRMQDLRNEDCKNVVYDQELPLASVIIIMYNEEPSLVLRTITSVLNASPRGYLKEIILVDDHSDDSSTKDILPRAIEFLFPPVVKLLRNKKQMGLTKARIVGADYSTGEVLAFLDAHCEVGPGWLEPYLQRIKEDYRNVVLPMFDHINIEKFNIQGSSVLIDAMDFNWGLGHTYSTLSEQKKAMLSESNAKFVPAATMPGCCFGIHRKWWEELGKYDPGFEVWGGENLEISFKIWMCGGKMETSPCSHQAHVYRLWLTKKRTVTNLQYLEANRKRLADVWMDDFKNIVYERHPEMKATNAGDITKRIALRKRLKCHSFDWYLKNVLPNKYIPTTRSKAKDGLQNIAGHCLDTMQQEPPASPKLYPFCHNGTTQRFDHSANNEIRVALDQCLEAKTAEKTVLLLPCSGTDSQKWTHTGPNSSIKALVDEKLCLRYNESDLELDFCDPLDQMQLWKFDNYFEGKTT